MMGKPKQLCSPYSSGGGGNNFEACVQSSFVVLMLSKGVFPCLSLDPIVKIELQSRYRGYETDDIIVYSENINTKLQSKILAQIKHNIRFNSSDKNFKETIQAAWNDFNNKDIFARNKDCIILITGPLSGRDTNGVRDLLNNAREAEEVNDFYRRIELARVTSNVTRGKLKLFENQLKKANNDIALKPDDVWEFLKHFHLLIYDLDIKGVTLALLHTIIEHHSPNNSSSIWCQIKDFVQCKNQHAGIITTENIPSEIISCFEDKNEIKIPEDYIASQTKVNLKKHKYAHDIALAFLLGSWNENVDADKQIVTKFVGEDYHQWIAKLRELIQEENSPLDFKNGVWAVKNRKELFKQIHTMIFDEDLDKLNDTVVKALKELDPTFEVAKEQRYYANILGKVHKYSYYLRKALAESLAIIGSYASELTNCSRYKPGNVTNFSLRAIFKDATWQLWAGLSDFLQLLAESAPKEFLEIVENVNPEIFRAVFAQEGSDTMTGRNYMVGLVRALESLAWDEHLFSKTVLVLAELASLDPGGNGGNRPINSLREIFMTWHMQTKASIEKQKAAIKALNKEFPDVTWLLIKSLLPNEHQIAFGTSKPIYRDTISDNWKFKITRKEHSELVSYYADFLIEAARWNLERYEQLIQYLPRLSSNTFDKIIKYMIEDSKLITVESEKVSFWNSLKNLLNQHRRFPNAKWVMSKERQERLETVVDLFKPKSLLDVHARLFSNKVLQDYSFEELKDKSFNAIILQRQDMALKEILTVDNSFESIIKFLEKVGNQYDLGFTLGKFEEYNYDDSMFPLLLRDKRDSMHNFVNAYIRSKFINNGWTWVDSLDKSEWLDSDLAKFYVYLPPHQDTFERIGDFSQDVQKEYWTNIRINSYEIKNNIDFVIEKLIQYKRKKCAIECLYFKYKIFEKEIDINVTQVVKALLLEETRLENETNCDSHFVLELIEMLQNSNGVNKEDLIKIEWKYLNWLDECNGYHIVALNQEFASNPEFFCYTIQLAYKSSKDTNENPEFTEEQKSIARHASGLLRKWNLIPGMQNSEGTLESNKFYEWVKKVRDITTESGHLDIALYILGEVLFFTPVDTDGFWINRTIAEFLNKKENEEVRNGFYIKTRNSRGAHWVDPEAKEELELARMFTERADATDSGGFVRLAVTLRELAEAYEDDAKRTIEEHNNN